MNKRVKAMLLFVALTSSLISCPSPNPNPNPNPNPSAYTVDISSLEAETYTNKSLAIQLAITGLPAKVELLRDSVVIATLTAPYQYTWDTTPEPENSYTLTARASDANGANVVVSAAKRVIVDRTVPTLVSRVPANGSSTVLITDEISLTFNEAILLSSITNTSVQIKNAATELARDAVLNSSGTKLLLTLNPAPTPPANLTVVVNGITDLAGNAAIVANSSFLIPASNTAQRIEVIVPPLGITQTSPRPDFKILLKNFSNSRVTFAEIFLDGKAFAYQDFASSCPELCVKDFLVPPLTSYFNGSYSVTAKVRQADGTVTLSQGNLSLGIAITNFYSSGGWAAVAPTNGNLIGIDTPSSLNKNAFLGSYGGFVVASGSNNLILRKQIAYSVERNQDHGLYLSAITGTRVPSNDKVVISVRDCVDANNCTVWNRTQSPDINISPPYFGGAQGAAYMEIELDFLSAQAEGNAYIGNIFVGQY